MTSLGTCDLGCCTDLVHIQVAVYSYLVSTKYPQPSLAPDLLLHDAGIVRLEQTPTSAESLPPPNDDKLFTHLLRDNVLPHPSMLPNGLLGGEQGLCGDDDDDDVIMDDS